ncbi:hypothetical protein ESCO_005674 [Escovopsis weberi]|uniref:Nucleic acid-binding, OB-fold protein n=1 Tax=Escovopsis weberi TaxID=150374 RepID=A0A0M8N4L1_ESCWE|nr:hypothetical protein ESCO_005674 [Escovopsis weberi]
MSPKFILFAGAPSPSIPPDACTLTTFSKPFIHLLNITNQEPGSISTPSATSTSNPVHAVAWRSLPATRRPLHTGLTQTINTHARDDSFFTTADVNALSSHDSLTHHHPHPHPHGHEDDNDNDVDDDGDDKSSGPQSLLSRFYEESFNAHRSLLADDTQDDSLTSNRTTDSFLTGASASASASAPVSVSISFASAPAPAPALCDLRDIPPAAHIAAQSPATVSRNLLVAVLSVAPPRAVTTRWGAPFSLVEVLVGDDTKSGFAITFWLPGADGRQNANGNGNGNGNANGAVVRAPGGRRLLPQRGCQVQVDSLRRQDVVLMRNIALHVFRGKVYGQSLPRGMTRLELLWRRAGGGLYAARDLGARAAARGAQRVKAARVKDWVVRFVGAVGAGASESARRTRSQMKSWDRPPDDSLD